MENDKKEMKIWNVSYKDRIMPPTQVLASDADEAVRAGVAAYRYNSQMDTGKKASDVVLAAELAPDQARLCGILSQPSSEKPPEKPVVNADGFGA